MTTDLQRAVRIAERNLGIITTQTLRRCRITDRQIERLVRTGQLERVHRGVYRLPGSPRTIAQAALAACAACGRGAVTSHRTGLEVWELIDPVPDRSIDLTLPSGRWSERDGIRVHRSIHLGPRDVTRVGVVPITRLARTLRDAAPQIGLIATEGALDEALRRRIVPPDQLLADLASGRGPLRKLARERLAFGAPEKEIERRALAALKRFGLPEPVRQLWVTSRAGRRHRIDLAYPDRRVAIELDGEAPHWGRDRWQADHDRQNVIVLDGWTILRYTWWDVTERPLDVALQVAEALGLVPTRWRSAAR